MSRSSLADAPLRLWTVPWLTATCLGLPFAAAQAAPQPQPRALLGASVHPDQMRSLAFSPDGKLLASAGEDKVVWLWDVAADKVKAALKGHTGWG